MGPKFVHKRGSRDKNEPLIKKVIEAHGIEYELLKEGAGADILLQISPMVFIEVKNPSYKWEYTDAEKKKMHYCKELGIPYHTVETPEEMEKVISDWIEKIEKGK